MFSAFYFGTTQINKCFTQSPLSVEHYSLNLAWICHVFNWVLEMTCNCSPNRPHLIKCTMFPRVSVFHLLSLNNLCLYVSLPCRQVRAASVGMTDMI